jgi:hypothetical protein
MSEKSKNIKDWEKFLDSEGVKNNLIRTSLYLFSYELLKNSIVDKIKDFYCIGFENNEDIYSKNYNKEVVNRLINGKQNIFLSSLYWLEEHGAITKDEINEISDIREFRNTVAHQIDRILADNDYNIDENKERRMFELMRKIEVWWIIEVEIPTNPDFDEKEIIYDEILPGKEIFYNYIQTITKELLKKKGEPSGE